MTAGMGRSKISVRVSVLETLPLSNSLYGDVTLKHISCSNELK